MHRLKTLIVLFILTCTLSLLSCGGGPKKKLQLVYSKVRRGDMTYTITATGTIEPLRKFEIKSLASGKVISMPVDTGSYVPAGGLICQVDPTEDRNNYENARAKYSVAELNLKKTAADLKRQEELFRNKFISSSTLEEYRLKLARAKAEHISARITRDNALKKFQETRVTAPISGIILEKNVETGQIIASGSYSVSGGTQIAVMADLSRVYIKALVDETEIARVKPGQKAQISVDAYSKRKFEGTVFKIEPKAQVEQNVTSFLVTVSINNLNQVLKPGMNASVKITTETLKDEILVPYTAVKTPPARRRRRRRGKTTRRTYVFVKKDGKPVPRRVKTGRTNFVDTVIKEGLKPGEEVVIRGLTSDKIKELLADARSGGRGGRRGRRRGRR